jgi:hypothetical protein
MDPAFTCTIREQNAKTVICSNLLEHVPDPGKLARQLVGLVPLGGSLIVTVPRAFPLHPDPIDTRFRPSVPELAGLFPGTRLVAGEVVTCGTLLSLLDSNPVKLLQRLMKMRSTSRDSAPRAPLSEWLWPWLLRPFEVTCIALERTQYGDVSSDNSVS